jgi:hypothetical protein
MLLVASRGELMTNSRRSEKEAAFFRIHAMYVKDLRPAGVIEKSLVHKIALLDFRIDSLLKEEGLRAAGLERLERDLRASIKLFFWVARQRSRLEPPPPTTLARLAAAAERFEAVVGGRAA